jgi:ribonuclease D
VIDTEHKLTAFLPQLRAASWVAVDTEADSLHSYPEKVCLIQISTSAGDRLIDPLANLNLAPLLETLSTHQLIMHGADYDLRLLCKHHKFIPKSVFDTMLAARLLGLREFGLAHLVEKYTGVKLEKGSQKANWARRPLTERMERYARDDTHYLKPLADRFSSELEAKGRLEWHRESCAQLIADSTRHHPPGLDSVWRVKGSHHLGRHALGVLRELWKWRENEALAGGKPPYFIMSHECLVDVAAAAAAGHSFEAKLPKRMSDRRHDALRRAVAKGLALPPEKLPGPLSNKGRRPSDAERHRFLDLQKRRDAAASRLGLDPTMIASRGMLSDLAHNWEKHAPELMNWQRELLR